jgi:hypothetical protein
MFALADADCSLRRFASEQLRRIERGGLNRLRRRQARFGQDLEFIVQAEPRHAAVAAGQERVAAGQHVASDGKAGAAQRSNDGQRPVIQLRPGDVLARQLEQTVGRVISGPRGLG